MYVSDPDSKVTGADAVMLFDSAFAKQSLQTWGSKNQLQLRYRRRPPT
jgi:hypothetical protein